MLGSALGPQDECGFADSPPRWGSHGIEANWERSEDDANVAWARALASALEPHSTGGPT
jgi:hypothetical protein